MLEMIINELNSRGYKAEAQNTIKNGVELEGIRILTDSNIAPVIYTKAIIENAENENKSLDEIVSAIVRTYESHKSFEFDVNMLFDRDFILNSIFVGLQKVSTEDIEKKLCEDFEGIESYLYIRGEADREGSYSIKVSKAILDRANISEVEAWEQAQTNTEAETSLESMAKVMCEMMNMEYSEDMDEMTPFFIISNKSKVKGASAILNKKVLAEFCERYHTNKIVVLPSSVHEMMLIPCDDESKLDMYSNLVKEVNYTQVDPVDRLTDRAYILEI